MTGLAGNRDDLDGTVGDFGYLQREQLADQVGMGARQRDQRLAGSAGNADDVAAQPVAVLVALTGNLLCGGNDTLGSFGLASHPDDDQAAGVRTGVTLNDACGDVTLASRELAVVLLVLRVAQPLQDHLPRRGRRDTTETLWGVVPFVEDVAVLVSLARKHLDNTGLAVNLDAGVGLVAFGMAVGGKQCRFDGLDHDVDRDAFVGLDGMQRRHVDIHAEASFPDWPASSSSR